MKIVVVDDEALLVKGIRFNLQNEGYEVLTGSNGLEAVELARDPEVGLMILDVMMPGEDGFATCRRIRALAACPILFLTAKTEEADVLTGLGLGGDDYLSKPFRIAELRARVAAHLRRESRAPRSRIRRGGLDFDLEERAVYCGFLDEPPALTATPRDCALVYLGAGSVPAGVAVRAGRELAEALGCDVYVAGVPEAVRISGGYTVACAPRFNFSELLPRTRVFVHHGGQNSMMDALSYEVPQVIVPGRIFERQFNAEAVENARCGLTVHAPKPALIARAARRIVVDEPALTSGIRGLHAELSSLGGTKRIVREVEKLVS